MPRKYSKRRSAYRKKKSKYMSRKKRSAFIATPGRTISSGPPKIMYIKQKYSEALSAPASVHQADLGYAANGIYDPQVSATSWVSISGLRNNSQGLWRDQLAAIYYTYQVVGCKIRVQVITTTASATNAGTVPPCILTIYPSNAVTTDTDPEITMTRSRGKAITFGGANFATRQSQSLTHYMKPWDVFGVSKRQYLDDPSSYGGLNSGSNPANLAYWNINLCNMSTSDDLKAYVQVDLTYYVRCFDLIENVAAS